MHSYVLVVYRKLIPIPRPRRHITWSESLPEMYEVLHVGKYFLKNGIDKQESDFQNSCSIHLTHLSLESALAHSVTLRIGCSKKSIKKASHDPGWFGSLQMRIYARAALVQAISWSRS